MPPPGAGWWRETEEEGAGNARLRAGTGRFCGPAAQGDLGACVRKEREGGAFSLLSAPGWGALLLPLQPDPEGRPELPLLVPTPAFGAPAAVCPTAG